MKVWPKERQAELEALKESGTPTVDIAEMLGVSIQVASYHLKGIESVGGMLDLLPSYPDEMVRIPDEPCALTADWHAPYLSLKWLRRLLAVCGKLGVRNCAIVGDFTDNTWLSRFLKKDQRGGLAGDMDITMTVLHMLLNFFGRVYWGGGNHEDRLFEALKGHDLFGTLGRWVAKSAKGELTYTDMRTMLLGDDWRLEHPKQYSRDAAKVAAAAAAIFHANVACAHGHHLGFRYDVSGKYIGLDLGGFFDEAKQEYLFKSGIVTLPVFNPGFWIYSGGKVRPFCDAMTDWAEWGTE